MFDTNLFITTAQMLAYSAFLSGIVGGVYYFFSNDPSDRLKMVFLIVALAVIIAAIISVIKSSLALSLGLVGALSIVRFRTPIKDPEQLIYLFAAITIGIGVGAGMRDLMIVTVAIVVVLILLFKLIRSRTLYAKPKVDRIHLHINASPTTGINLLEAVENGFSQSKISFITRSYSAKDDTRMHSLVINDASLSEVERALATIMKAVGDDANLQYEIWNDVPTLE